MYVAVHPGRVLRRYLPEDMTIGEAARPQSARRHKRGHGLAFVLGIRHERGDVA